MDILFLTFKILLIFFKNLTLSSLIQINPSQQVQIFLRIEMLRNALIIHPTHHFNTIFKADFKAITKNDSIHYFQHY